MADAIPFDKGLRLKPDLHVRHWGTDTLVYNAVNGNTHLLCDEAAQLLRAIETNSPSLPNNMDTLISELQGLGLIEQAGS